MQHLNQESLDDPEPKSGLRAWRPGRLLNCDRAADRGCVFFFRTITLLFLSSPKAEKSTLRMADPGGRPPGPEPGFRLFEFQGERERGSFLFSKACKSLCRRRFKKIEYAPLAAYIFFEKTVIDFYT